MRWSVFSIEYPPETYTVKYDTDRSNLDMKSNVLQGQEPSNHQVQLSALQWNTTYSYYCSVMVCNECGKEVETDPDIHVSTVLVHERAAPQGTDIWDVMTCCVLLCNLTHTAIAMLCAY